MLAITAITSALAFAANSVFATPIGEAVLVARQGYIPECFKTYSVSPGDTCNVIINKFNATFTLEEFYEWNPQVADGCYNLYPNEIVCVGLNTTGTTPPACPVPVAPGLVSNCASCHEVIEGDNCYALSQEFSVSIDDLKLWNPSLNAGCSNLQLGYNYCVGV